MRATARLKLYESFCLRGGVRQWNKSMFFFGTHSLLKALTNLLPTYRFARVLSPKSETKETVARRAGMWG
jgi:hypothetical protein